VRDSVQTLQHTLLPATAQDGSGNSDSSPLRRTTADPVWSYLTTGKSVKIVAVHSASHNTEPEPGARGGNSAGLRAGSESRSLALDSYFGGRFTSNVHYLKQELSLSSHAYSGAQQDRNGRNDGEGVAPVNAGESEQGTNLEASPVQTLARLFQYSHHSAKSHLTLTTALRRQLRHARADCADHVARRYHLLQHLRAVKDVFLLGQPDLFASVREFCLTLTCGTRPETGATTAAATPRFSGRESVEALENLCDAVTASVRDVVPEVGLRYISATCDTGGGGAAVFGSPVRSSARAQHPAVSSLDVKGLTALLREVLQPLSFTGAALSTQSSPTRSSSLSGSNEIPLLLFVSTLCVSPTYERPLTQFFTAEYLEQLNRQLRFLLLLTAARWTAEYYWLEVISNDSLSIDPLYLEAAPSPPYKRSAPPTAAPRTESMARDPAPSYARDVLQAKRNCRAGLGVWLHTVTALNNIFMAHIHRSLWPSFEAELAAQSASLLLMQHAFGGLLAEVGDSLMLLREMALEVVIRGYVATWAMRTASDTEKEARALHTEATSPGVGEIGGADSGNKNGRETSNSHRVPRVNVPSSPKAVPYTPTAAVLIAYHQAEDAFAALTQVVSDLRHVVALTIRHRAERGLSERQDRALAELQIALSR
jgi:hypothetical protein